MALDGVKISSNIVVLGFYVCLLPVSSFIS